ncbi:MAG: transporter substrate-binding domain-containing protein [Marinobacter sp.]|nr:transporter substrate-binding domain-containing protein [Marinobacter sp.]
MSLIKRYAALWLMALSLPLAAEITITVGAYNYPSIALIDDQGALRGLAGDVLAELNQRQSDYHFVFQETAPKRRYMDFEQRRYDVILFESPSWSWQAYRHYATRPFLSDQELYVALAKPERDESFFDDLQSRALVAIFGFHYGFAGNNPDDIKLTERFNIDLSHSHRRNLELILADRPAAAEVAVVSRSFLASFKAQRPEDYARLLVSERVDQHHDLAAIVHPEAPVTAETLESMIDLLVADGTFAKLAAQYGIPLHNGTEHGH